MNTRDNACTKKAYKGINMIIHQACMTRVRRVSALSWLRYKEVSYKHTIQQYLDSFWKIAGSVRGTTCAFPIMATGNIKQLLTFDWAHWWCCQGNTRSRERVPGSLRFSHRRELRVRGHAHRHGGGGGAIWGFSSDLGRRCRTKIHQGRQLLMVCVRVKWSRWLDVFT